MSGSGRRVLYSLGALALLLSPLPFAAPATAADPAPSAPSVAPLPADPFVPPPAKQLDPRDIILKRGDKPGQATLETRDGGPLSVLLVVTSGDGRVKVVSPGADFSRPSTWRQLGFGDICWKYAQLPETDTFVLPGSQLPFTGPPGDWTYSNVIVGTERGPVVFNKPLAGEFVTGQGSPIQSVISCVSAASKERSYRADPTPTASPLASAATGLQPFASPSATADLQPLPSASGSLTSPGPTASVESTQDVTTTSASNDKKIVICHATSSDTNPYNLIEVAKSAAENGHGGHTGPLYPQQGWGDVIPPFDDFPGLNWPAGQGLLDAGCAVAPPDPELPPLVPITPELPIKPAPPIIEIKPPVRPELPIATLPPSPSGTASAPLATVEPRPSGTASAPLATVEPRPSGTASAPLATVEPRPSGTASAPLATVEPRPSGTASAPLATVEPRPSGTASAPLATVEPRPSGTASAPLATVEPRPSGTATPTGTAPASGTPSPEATAASPEATTGPGKAGTVVDDLNRYCESKDDADLPASLQTLRTDLIITNGVSSITVKRPFTSLYCAARPLPGTAVDMPAEVGGGVALVDTGYDPRVAATASLLLIGIGLLLIPALARRR